MKTLLILLLPTITFGQTVIQGNVVNKKTKLKVPFATVGLTGENIGTNANENGFFTFTQKVINLRDTLIVSCVGYETLKLPIENLPQTIELYEKQVLLSEVTVTSKLKWEYVKLNEKDCGNIGYTTRGIQTQIAQFFTSPSDNAILKEVEICKSNPLFETNKSVFRLRFYEMDTVTKAPSYELCDDLIEVKTISKKTKVNLEKYKIHIPQRNFFVAIEWLKIPYNVNNEKVTIDGKKEEYITYRPVLTCNHASEKSQYKLGTPYEVWGLSYQNKWFPILWIKDLSVSATVKY